MWSRARQYSRFSVLVMLLALGLCSTARAGEASWLAAQMSLADARHLLQRTGFGARTDEILALRGQTRAAGIERILQGFEQPLPQMPEWVNAPAPLYWTRSALAPADQQRFDQARDLEFAHLQRWWVDQILDTHEPQRERMVLFWHDLLATSYHSLGGRSVAIARQHQWFREQALGSWRELLYTLVRDPAMLQYLDNLDSHKAGPNENFGRELLERFTLGVGHYSEQDVLSAARALTGYSVQQEYNLAFRFKPWAHDETELTLFGQSAALNGESLVDAILQQPRAAEFMAERFWQAFVDDVLPQPEEITALADAFRESDYQLSTLYRAVLRSEAFWDASHRASIIKPSAVLLLGAVRSLEYPAVMRAALPGALTRSGMALFAPPNVSGWKDGVAWVASGRLLNRIDTLTAIAHAAVQTESVNPQMQAGNTMNNSDSSMTMMDSPGETLRLRLAAESYQGAPQYVVALLREDETIWESEVKRVRVGHDTERYGRIMDFASLPWHEESMQLPAAALQQASALAVRYLFDAAASDRDADRNLYVGGAWVSGHWLDSSSGQQSGRCPPERAAEAGKLYCEGELRLPLEPRVAPSSGAGQAPSLAGVHIRWADGREQPWRRLMDLILSEVELVWQDTRVHFNQIGLRLLDYGKDELWLELRQFDTWPPLFDRWPDCAAPLQDTVAGPGERWFRVPISKTGLISGSFENETGACTIQALDGRTEQLLGVLVEHLGGLLLQAGESPRVSGTGARAQQFRDMLNHFSKRLDVSERSARMVMTDQPPSLEPRLHYTEPTSRLDHAGELELLLDAKGISLGELLMPGIEPSQWPPTINSWRSLPFAAQVQRLLALPEYQLQ